MMNNKIFLVYKDGNEYKVESVWATKVGEFYRIDNIPFFAKNIASGDIVSVENDEGQLYFDELIQASGNSVVRIVFFDEKNIPQVTKELEKMGCNWEGSHSSNLISVDIPKSVSYESVKSYLIKGRQDGLFDYQEACLGFK